MNWETFAWTWGPAAPLVALLLKILYDAVYRVIPKGFKAIRDEGRRAHKRAKNRHKEHMAAMESLHEAIASVPLCKDALPQVTAAPRSKPRRRKPAKKKAKRPAV